MNSRDTIQKELNELNSSLPQNMLPETYLVPEGYFEGFAASVLSKIKEEQQSAADELASFSPILAGISRQMPFSIPEGYFNQISDQLPELIREEEVPEILLQAGKSMPYQVPKGYFNNLPHQVVSQLNPKPQAKVISFQPVRWMRYASAAVIAGIIALGSILYFGNNKQTVDPNKHPQEWVASKLKNVSNKELEEFIKTADVKSITGTETAVGKPASRTEVRKLLKDVSTDEMDAFLSQLPADNEDFSAIN